MSTYYFNKWKSRPSQLYAWIEDNLFVSGDITLDGTVDGRDIADDGAQLDDNTSDIATNAGNISTNAGDIATNAGDIATIESNFLDKTSTSENTIEGDITLAEDKKIALKASGATATTLATISNSVGDIVSFETVNSIFKNIIEQSGGEWSVADSAGTRVLNVKDSGIITGPSTIPTDITTGGVDGLAIGSDGALYISETGTSAQNHILLHNSNGNVANVVVTGTTAKILNQTATGNVSIGVSDWEVTIDQVNGCFRPNFDNTKSCGLGSLRWSVVYAGTGTINTSDEDEKTFHDLTPDQEYDKLLDAVDATPIKAYQFNDAIEAKGAENARMHFGIGAQTLKSNLEAQGLDPFKYAVLCFDEWEEEVEDVFDTEVVTPAVEAVLDEEGNVIEEAIAEVTREVKTGTKVVLEAGSRYGIRYDEFYAVKLASLEQRLTALEAN